MPDGYDPNPPPGGRERTSVIQEIYPLNKKYLKNLNKSPPWGRLRGADQKETELPDFQFCYLVFAICILNRLEIYEPYCR